MVHLRMCYSNRLKSMRRKFEVLKIIKLKLQTEVSKTDPAKQEEHVNTPDTKPQLAQLPNPQGIQALFAMS